jgi:hypothetical protein
VTTADAAKLQNSLAKQTATDEGKPEKIAPNWRKGIFKGADEQVQEQVQEKQQEPEFGSSVQSVTYGDPSKIGRHAKRRAAKKAK